MLNDCAAHSTLNTQHSTLNIKHSTFLVSVSARDDTGRHLRFSLPMLSDFIARARRLVVLTGAGCSTESGIPDYRSPGGAWTRHKPISYSSFVRSAEVRRFYWARS